ncbi:MAG: glycosyl transferase family 2 [Geminicoccaceae bacterium]|nr:glycosyl transferase family 2 [Geminicoccaceae bacterium]
MVANPVVSIGLPVYNGENYLACAIESILAQSFTDFELIISDNASTDGTSDICRTYAARDARVRHVRNPRNIGAAANFNSALAQAAGRYCKWMAHDDVLAPDFLATSLTTLQAQPDAVLCYSAADIIDRHGGLLFTDDSRLPGTERPRPSDRFAEAIINQHMCFPIFALIRAEALRTSSLLANYDGSDRALVAELALRGRFAYVPWPLFQNRDHPERYIRAVRPQRASALDWWAGRAESGAVLHLWALYGDYFRVVRRELSDPVERLRCYRSLVRWLAVDWNAVRLLVDVIALIDPRVFDLARSVKQGLLGRPDAPDSDGAAVESQGVRKHDARA